MALIRLPIVIAVFIYFWLLQFTIGYIAYSLISGCYSGVPILASALEVLDKDSQSINDVDQTSQEILMNRCGECRITSESMETHLRKPRQMNAYGKVSDRLDIDIIKKAICKDIESDLDREKCRSFFFRQTQTIEKWRQVANKASFFDYVCIKEMKICCPRGSYGPRCTKCPVCNANEKCSGEGTRAGNGTCICREGHSGPRCNSCLPGFYKAVEGVGKSPGTETPCKQCHKSCRYCRHGGPTGCDVCRQGYTWVAPFGCSDVDECLKDDKKVCGDNTFCVNTEGSYFCYECDRACNGCHGDGPDMCLGCADGYKLENGYCVATKKTILPPEANYFRYAIYIGLCISTCIILNNNVYVASAIGLAVAVYIGSSEYIMSTHLQEMEARPGAEFGSSFEL